MKSVVCFGDSNTWGAVPVPDWDHLDRHGPDERWPGILRRRLGSGWDVIAEGLPGRTTVLDDPVDGEHFSGLRYLLPCLMSHKPVDYMTLMLGTNDLKRRFNVSAEEVGTGIERLLAVVRQSECLAGGMDRVVVISPAPLTATGVFTTMFEGGEEKSRDLAKHIGGVARAAGAHFIDAGDIVMSSTLDGIHLDASEHLKLGNAVADFLKKIAGSP